VPVDLEPDLCWESQEGRGWLCHTEGGHFGLLLTTRVGFPLPSREVRYAGSYSADVSVSNPEFLYHVRLPMLLVTRSTLPPCQRKSVVSTNTSFRSVRENIKPQRMYNRKRNSLSCQAVNTPTLGLVIFSLPSRSAITLTHPFVMRATNQASETSAGPTCTSRYHAESES
jgi:hypothetical protein